MFVWSDAPKVIETTSTNEPRYGIDYNELRYDVDILHVVRHIQIRQFHSVHSYGCDQTHLGFPHVILNIKSSIYQD